MTPSRCLAINPTRYNLIVQQHKGNMVVEIKMVIEFYEGNVKRMIRPREIWVDEALIHKLDLSVVVSRVVEVFLPWRKQRLHMRMLDYDYGHSQYPTCNHFIEECWV